MNDSSGLRQNYSQQQFATTQWSIVIAAGDTGPESAGALEKLCQAYWYPLYRYVRSRGYPPEQSADLTQGFFTRLIEKNDFESVRKEKGRFRSFLLASIKNFVANERDRQQAQKRGGDVSTFSFDSATAEQRFSLDPGTEQTPEIAFEKSWALAILEQAQLRLKDDFQQNGKQDWYNKLSCYLTGDNTDAPTYADVAADLNVSESAIKVNVHRMRKLFGRLLRDEIANTVASESDIDDELRRMFEVLSN